jgi:cyanophycin synthetase
LELVDSRRLTGANILWSGPGAVLDVRVAPAESAAGVAAWRREVRTLLDALGWTASTLYTRVFDGGASLAFDGPIDALYAATEINECALERAVRSLGGQANPPLAGEVARLGALVAEEVEPPRLALQAAAAEHGVAFMWDDDHVSVGLGTGSRTYATGALPTPDAIDWDAVHDVPCALVTGTNGKTTTVRLLAAMASAAGHVPGFSSTDWVRVGDEVLDRGDWSGPGGARFVLRDRRTTIGLLETARGGMLRRGLAVERADVSAVLNVAADHLGEWGVGSIEALADGKFVVTSVAPVAVLNADDPLVAERGRALEAAGTHEIVWFTLTPETSALNGHLEHGGRAALVVDDEFVLARGADATTLCRVDEVAVALGGAARHNLANALAAAAIARELGIPDGAIAAALRSFGSHPDDNPGRLERFRVNGADVLLDFAHNPHGFAAILATARSMRPTRLAVLVGQAGDRDDESIRGLARETWRAEPDRVFVKELASYLRGREPGEIPGMIRDELLKCGAAAERIEDAGDELEAVRRALAWLEPGDVLVALVHGARDAARDLVVEAAGAVDPER